MGERIILRDVTPKDAADIHRLNRDGLGYDFSLSETEERLRYILKENRDNLIAAELDGRVVGYIHGEDYECTYSPPMKNILALVVEPGVQGTGVGRRLITALEQWARADGSTGVRLTSGENRQEAHKFYEACGYINRKNQKNFFKLFEWEG